jgi:hypothetical protein
MRASACLVEGCFCGAELEPGTFHWGMATRSGSCPAQEPDAHPGELAHGPRAVEPPGESGSEPDFSHVFGPGNVGGEPPTDESNSPFCG